MPRPPRYKPSTPIAPYTTNYLPSHLAASLARAVVACQRRMGLGFPISKIRATASGYFLYVLKREGFGLYLRRQVEHEARHAVVRGEPRSRQTTPARRDEQPLVLGTRFVVRLCDGCHFTYLPPKQCITRADTCKSSAVPTPASFETRIRRLPNGVFGTRVSTDGF